MNKAFVREPDQGIERCPRCGSPGEPVQQTTLAAHVPPQASSEIAQSANFCPFPNCDVVYFDMFERVILTAALDHPVYPKDPAAPICACFGLTEADIEQDVAEGAVTRTRAVVEKAKSSAARCAQASPSGQSCVAAVQRYYMKVKQGG